MSLLACAEAVRQGDPDRFAATMAAPARSRDRLWPLYAANLELARAPWAAREPMVAEMRLQWWIDTFADLANGTARPGDPVSMALAPLFAADPALAELFAGIAEARRHDCWSAPFADRAAFAAYLDATAGNLMWAAARSLGAPATAEATVRDFAWGAGLAQWFRAAPELAARGRPGLADGTPGDLAALAAEGRARIARARADRRRVPLRVRPALWPGAGAGRLLALAEADPGRIAAGRLAPSEFARRGRLVWCALTGRF